NDLGRGEIAVETLITCGAKRACHRAARLAGDAQGAAIVLGDEDGFDGVVASDVEQPLARAVGRALLRRHARRDDGAPLAELAAKLARRFSHVVARILAALVHPALQLLGANRLAAPLRDEIAPFGTAKAKKIYGFDRRHGQDRARLTRARD